MTTQNRTEEEEGTLSPVQCLALAAALVVGGVVQSLMTAGVN